MIDSSHNTLESSNCDYYHLLMAQGFYNTEFEDRMVCFEFFFRHLPFKSGYGIFSGLGSLLEIIQNFHFSKHTLEFLQEKGVFQEEFINYLKNWKFSGQIFSLQEGEIVFPSSPIMRVEGNILECHLIEAISLNILNYQSLVSTKSSRMFLAAQNKPFIEMGLRRGYGPNGAFFATRACFIGGAKGTSNVVAASVLKIPVFGSMSHSWVMSFDTEYEAFMSFARVYPENQVFLVDTYNTIKQGLPQAIQAFLDLEKETIGSKHAYKAIRIDSGDLDYLSKKAREDLDGAGLHAVKILVSDNIDEKVLEQLNISQAPIDMFGIGTQLVSKFDSDFSGVYKLVSIFKDQHWQPKIKISETPQKTTIAGNKNIIRFFNKENIALMDYIFLEEEREELLQHIANKLEIEVFYPFSPYSKKRVYEYENYEILLQPVMEKGVSLLGEIPLSKIQEYMKARLNHLHTGHKRLTKPHAYSIGYSYKLAAMTWDALESHLKDR